MSGESKKGPEQMKTTRKLTVLVAAGLAACVVAACGSSSSSSSASSSSAASGTNAATAVRSKFVTCLKAHGVTVPAFRRPGGGAAGCGAPPPGSGTGGAGGTPPPGGFRRGGGGGFFQRFRSNPKMQAAFKACAADLPKGGFRGRRFGGGFGGRPQRAAITKFVTCIRQHGYNLPAPNLSGKGPVFPPKIESNAKFQAASRSCRNLLVPQGAGSGSGSGGGSSA
jgi:hypothetical protein